MMSLFYCLYAVYAVSRLSASFDVSVYVFLVGSLYSAYDRNDLINFYYVLTFLKSQVCLMSKEAGQVRGRATNKSNSGSTHPAQAHLGTSNTLNTRYQHPYCILYYTS
jgi:hypothetical protein